MAVRRSLYVLTWLAPACGLIALAMGGFGWILGPVRLSSREPVRPVIVSVIAALAYVWRSSLEQREADGRWLLDWLRRGRQVVVPLAILAGLIVGIHYGSFAAAGSDSYGYVSQAPLWLRGDLHIKQPWVAQMSWAGRDWAFAPLGYRPSSPDGTIVPTYSAGLPILMAAFLRAFGPNGPFYVVPVLGALALWFTYLLGVEVSRSKSVGACAALLLLVSPVFLAHLMLPMTDVPMAAGWTLVMWLTLKEPRPHPLAAGLAAGAALLIRPNLLLLAAAPVTAWLWPCARGQRPWRDAGHDVLVFALGMAPGVLAIAAINTTLYGSPLESGYGGLGGDMYELARAPRNLLAYGAWLVQSQTPLVALALLPFAWPSALRTESGGASARAGLVALLVTTLASYVFYYVFNFWLYVRFLLPALPSLLVLMAAGMRAACARLPRPAAAVAAILLPLTCAAFGARFTRQQFIFNQREFEQRHVRAAHYVAQLTPPRSIILAVQHSGSLRYYANRITLRYDYLAPDALDAVIRELTTKGYSPYIVIDDWEEVEFRKRFGKDNRVGRLDWKPLVRVMGNPEVRIYDPEGRATP